MRSAALRHRVVLCALLSLFLIAHGSDAQVVEPAIPDTKPEAAPPPDKPEVKTISISQIGVASESEKGRLSEMIADLKPTPEVEAARTQIPNLRRKVDTVRNKSKAMLLGAPSLLELSGLRNKWEDLQKELRTTQETLSARAKAIGKTLAELRSTDEIWQATRDKAVEREADPAILTQIEEVESSIKSTEARAKDRQADLLALQSDVASLNEIAKADLKRISASLTNVEDNLLQRDQPPVWSPLFWGHVRDADIGRSLAEQRTRQLEALTAFWQRERDSVILQAVLTLLLGAFMFRVRPMARRQFQGDEEISKVGVVFESPIAVTLLSSFMTAAFWMGTRYPALNAILAAAILFPAVVLLRRIVEQPLLPILNALVVFFIVDRIRETLDALVVVPRLIFLVEAIVALALFTYWLRPARLHGVPPEVAQGRTFRIIGYGLRAGLIMISISLLADVGGYTSFSSILGRTVSTAIYGSIAIYGTVYVLDGLVMFLLRVGPLERLGMVRRNRRFVQRRLGLLVRWAAWILWISITLKSGNLLNHVLESAQGLLATALPLPSAKITIGDVIAAILTLWFTLLLSRFVRFALEEDVYTRIHLPKGQPYAISTLVKYVILTAGFVLAGSVLGVDLNRFTLLAGALGVGIGFGLQTIVNNFVSGIILLTERPIEIGDTISLDDVFGIVQRIGIRSSTVRTWQGAEIILPNADLISLPVTNWTLTDRRRRLEIPVGVAYGSDPRRVTEVLLETARNAESVLVDPEAYVLFQGFGDSSLDFEVRAWTDEFDSYLQVRSAICTAIVEALNEAGITIPFPQRDLHVKTIVQPADGDSTSPAPELAPPAPPGAREQNN